MTMTKSVHFSKKTTRPTSSYQRRRNQLNQSGFNFPTKINNNMRRSQGIFKNNLEEYNSIKNRLE